MFWLRNKKTNFHLLTLINGGLGISEQCRPRFRLFLQKGQSDGGHHCD